ncbi:c-type cytochrome [Desulfuromonas versatilis]|uniref:C-type cytochrome n=1 Tax=Desulfuromonas versatilis TaxID=2802975 RepID=A0ABM8I0A2_9BACT|nr:OmcA/MtrC family decaheme c-type cytochrome [Desulfuromonas versatilis]BCR06777.1 c-type cytochrome [Desulfuromonas versatilis]
MKRWNVGAKLLLVAMLTATLGLAGCGDDGSQGPVGLQGAAGADGADGAAGAPGTTIVDASLQTPETLAALTPTAEVTGVTINSPPVVSFTVKDANGRGIAGLGAIRDGGVSRLIRINIAKLVPGAAGSPDSWVNYIRSGSGSPTTENNGTLVDNGDGSYVYTFSTDVTAVAAVPYEPTLTHRVAAQIGDGAVALPAMNMTFDFVPAGGIVAQRDIAMTTSCNECHGKLTVHGRRFEVKYCVTCHNPDLTAGAGDMTTMVHKIHMGAYLANGYSLGGHDYSGVVYPMNTFSSAEGLKNCAKCHSGADAATPQGDNWKTRPSRVACGSCHDAIDFAAGTGHLAQTNDSSCASCHVGTGSSIDIEIAHRTVVSTENNPEVPAWAKILQYEIASVSLADTATANQKQATVRFRVLAKQLSTDTFAPVNLNNLASVGATAQNLSFRLIWAAPQAAPADVLDGPAIAAPADWNNAFGAGRSYFDGAVDTTLDAFDQPVSVNLSTVLAGLTQDAEGYYTANLNYNLSAQAFAAVNASSMRAIGLEGGLTMTNPNTGAGVLILGKSLIVGEGSSVANGETTNTARRQVVNMDRCNACHEWLGFHGSQARNNNPDYCVACHNAEITNSGRGTANGVTYGEFSNNLKDMVHAIHGAEKRTLPFDFVRGNISATTGGQGVHLFGEVDFLGRAADCSACHDPGTFLPEAVPANAIWSTLQAAPTTAVTNFVPEANLRMAPISSACFACHDSAAAENHMAANVAFTRNGPTETCVTCHGEGRSADVQEVH